MHSIDALVDRYLNYLLVEKGLAEKTIESYSRDLIRFVGFLKSDQIHVISDIDARIILKHLINLRDQDFFSIVFPPVIRIFSGISVSEGKEYQSGVVKILSAKIGNIPTQTTGNDFLDPGTIGLPVLY